MGQTPKLAQTIERTNAILDVLRAEPAGVPLMKLVTETQLAKSTVHRLLATLVHFRFVRQDPATKRYHLGFKLVELGNTLLSQIDVRKEANPLLVGLSNTVNEAVHLVIRDGDSAIYIDKVDTGAKGGLQMASRVGMKIPLYSSAVGKIFLAHMSEDEVRALYAGSAFAQLTPKTITTLGDLLEHLRHVKKLGFAIDDEENEYGIRCIAAPIVNNTNEVVAAMSVSGASSQVTIERIERSLAAQIRETAGKISAALGYVPH